MTDKASLTQIYVYSCHLADMLVDIEHGFVSDEEPGYGYVH